MEFGPRRQTQSQVDGRDLAGGPGTVEADGSEGIGVLRRLRGLPDIGTRGLEVSRESYSSMFLEGATINHIYSSWHWPDIDGFQTFKGHKCHSAAWDETYDYSGKTIAVIGNGSSGVQIIPKLANLPSTTVITFQRSPNYVYTHLAPASLLGSEDLSPNPAYTEEDIKRFREDKEFHRNYRRKMIQQINSAFTMVRASLSNREAAANGSITVCQGFGSQQSNHSCCPEPDGREA